MTEFFQPFFSTPAWLAEAVSVRRHTDVIKL
jgi:hypothetical protein